MVADSPGGSLEFAKLLAIWVNCRSRSERGYILICIFRYCRYRWLALLMVAVGFSIRANGQIFVDNWNSDTIGEYDASGATINASLITDLHTPDGIAISGSNLFVANFGF